MSTVYDQIEARAIRSQQRILGKQFDILPMTARPNKRAVQDTTRAAAGCVWGIKTATAMKTDVDKTADHVDRSSRRPGSMSFNSVRTKRIVIEFLYCDLPNLPRQGDWIVEKDTDRAYSIVDILPSGHSEVKFVVNEVEGPYRYDD